MYAARVQLQKQLSNWMEERLQPMAVPHEVYAAVQVELRGEVRQIVQKDGEPDGEMKIGSHKAMTLPGLGTIDKPLTGVAAPDISVKLPGRKSVDVRRQLETQVERIGVTLFVDKDMPAGQREKLKEVATELAGLDASRGDALTISELPPKAAASRPAQGGGSSLPGSLLLICGTVVLATIILSFGLVAGRAAQAGQNRITMEDKRGADEPSPADAAAGEEPGAVSLAQAAVLDEDGTRAFAFLRGARAEEIAELVGALEPDVAAAVLDQVGLDQEAVSRLFQRLPAERQVQLALALGRARVIPRTALQEMEIRVQAELERVRSRVALGGDLRLADLLAQAPEEAQRDLLDALGRSAPDLARAVRQHMILFEDLARLEDAVVRRVVTAVAPATVATALVGAPEPVRDAVMRSVSKRFAAILEAEAQAVEGKPATDVQAARKAVESAIRKLQAAGEIRPRAAA
ncbi:hypothetical protein AMPC_11860 [Anaeromyxobacter paludicola]|uniref:Flagellar motor switch protein FliG C-terminal domain-containing protein n=1 Tax=Anaeromyxobacter paludicola TaxID=2918171 RepID=A0ABN6N7D8_9BACT|nr:hypothetical protein AMPC_11860 [Anaeromyxobacter paludicola]